MRGKYKQISSTYNEGWSGVKHEHLDRNDVGAEKSLDHTATRAISYHIVSYHIPSRFGPAKHVCALRSTTGKKAPPLLYLRTRGEFNVRPGHDSENAEAV